MNKEDWKKAFTYIFQFITFWIGIYLMWEAASPDKLEMGILGTVLAVGVFYTKLNTDYKNKLREKDETLLKIIDGHMKDEKKVSK